MHEVWCKTWTVVEMKVAHNVDISNYLLMRWIEGVCHSYTHRWYKISGRYLSSALFWFSKNINCYNSEKNLLMFADWNKTFTGENGIGCWKYWWSHCRSTVTYRSWKLDALFVKREKSLRNLCIDRIVVSTVWYLVTMIPNKNNIYLNGQVNASRTSGPISIGSTRQVLGSPNPFCE